MNWKRCWSKLKNSKHPNWTVKPLSLWCVFVQPPFNANNSLPSGYILMVLQPLALCRYNKQADARTHTHTQYKSINPHKHCANRFDVYYHNIIPYHWQRFIVCKAAGLVRILHWHRLYSIHFLFSLVLFLFQIASSNEKSLNFSIWCVLSLGFLKCEPQS